MRMAALVGTGLIILGAIVLVRGISYKSEEAAVRVGEFEAKVEARRTVPAWVGGVAIVAGLVIIGAGMKRG